MESDAKDRFVVVKDPEGKPRRMLLPRQHDGGWPYSQEMLDRIARNEGSVLITGESGTGKELLAYYLHGKSQRSNGPLVAVNCTGLTEELMRGELFGSERGSFTGAVSKKEGVILSAAGGTVFLDEIGNMDPLNQGRLLRFLETGKIEPVGGKPQHVNVRVIAATNKGVSNLIPDLYYRFRFVNLRLPALRDRQSDIFRLLPEPEYLGMKDPFTGITVPTLLMLAAQDWPGNIREFKRYCEDTRMFADIRKGYVCMVRRTSRDEPWPFPKHVFHDARFPRDAKHIMGTLDLCLRAGEKGYSHLVDGGGKPPQEFLNTLALLWLLNNNAYSFMSAPSRVLANLIVPLPTLRKEILGISGTGGSKSVFRFEYILPHVDAEMHWPLNFGQKHCRWLYAILHLAYFCRTRKAFVPTDTVQDIRAPWLTLRARPPLEGKFYSMLSESPSPLPGWEMPEPPVQEKPDSPIEEKLSNLDTSKCRKFEPKTVKQVLRLHHTGLGPKEIAAHLGRIIAPHQVSHLVREYGKGFEPLKKHRGGRPPSPKTRG